MINATHPDLYLVDLRFRLAVCKIGNKEETSVEQNKRYSEPTLRARWPTQ